MGYYVLAVVLIFLAGFGTGALVWRNNATRFKELEGQGKQALGDLTGKGKS